MYGIIAGQYSLSAETLDLYVSLFGFGVDVLVGSSA